MSFRKIMALVFGVGLFITGIGAGVAFVEYSGFAYGGEKALYEDQVVTDIVPMKLGEDSEIIRYANPGEGNVEIAEDPSLERDEIIFEITYNQAFAHPYVAEQSHNMGGAATVFCLASDYRQGMSNFRMFMDYKDIILEGLKNQEIPEFEANYDYSCKIKTAPENIGRVTEVFL